MKFHISTTESQYPEKDKDLEAIGFKFRSYKYSNVHHFIINSITKEFNTLEELVEFTNKHQCIITGDHLEIYNGWRE